VLDQMVRYGYLPQAKAEVLKQSELGLDYNNVATRLGRAPYFRQEMGQYLEQWLKTYNQKHGTSLNLYTDGLKVYTTIDVQMQQHAEDAVKAHMPQLQQAFDQHWRNRDLWDIDDPGLQRALHQSRRYQGLEARGQSEEEIMAHFRKPREMEVWTWEGYEKKTMSPLDSLIHYNSFLQAGLMAMDPQNGYVRAWVGGINYRHFNYDHVTARRQVGSTFKPIVYAAALSMGLDPCQYLPNERVSYADYKNWQPGNADGQYEGYYSLKGGLVKSVNTISAAVMMKVGVENAVQFARRFGFEAELPADPSLVLGTADLSVQEMVGAYSAFANRGTRAIPVCIAKITDSQGKVLAEWPQERGRQRVMSQEVADQMVNMMQAVVDSGTARRLRFSYGLRTDLAGKTGTTQNQTDGWFMGVTPRLVVGTWVGGDDRQVRFRSLSLGQGANTALPIFGRFMQQVYRDDRYRSIRNARFPEPDPRTLEQLDCALYSPDGYDPNQGDLRTLIQKLRDEAQERRERRQEKLEQRRDRWDRFFDRQRNNREGGGNQR